MAINLIGYSDKADINVNANVPDVNKVKADDMNEIKSVVNSNSNLMGDVANIDDTSIVDYLNNHTKGTLLWTNTNMGDEDYFNQQSIFINMSDYDIIEVFFFDYSKTKRYSSVRVPKGKTMNLTTMFDYNGHSYAGLRTIYYRNSGELWANDCYAIITANAFSSLSVSNQWCVPVYIVGYKRGIF